MKKVLVGLVLCVIVKAGCRHHPKFPKALEEYDVPLLKKVPCSSDLNNERSSLIEGAKCGAPKEVFIILRPRAAHEEIHPGAVWVKRCVGLCDHEGPDYKCVASEVTIRHIPIKIFNVKTNKEMCSSYPVEEHVACKCCAGSPADCAAPQVFSPRKCSCQCPNAEDRRACLAQRNMRWNRSKCICEERIRHANAKSA